MRLVCYDLQGWIRSSFCPSTNAHRICVVCTKAFFLLTASRAEVALFAKRVCSASIQRRTSPPKFPISFPPRLIHFISASHRLHLVRRRRPQQQRWLLDRSPPTRGGSAGPRASWLYGPSFLANRLLTNFLYRREFQVFPSS